MNETEHFDLASYFARLGYQGPAKADLPSLQALHAAHLETIPFENVDVLLGRPISLELPVLQNKIVRMRRGGYCFEQNTLFAAALRALGFRVSTLEARVRPPGAASVLPRTHMILQVDIGERAWLADVGFGGDGPLVPVPLDFSISEQAGGSYRVVQEDDIRVLQLQRRNAWRDLYSFTLTPAYPIDFKVANHFTSTYPQSPFVKTLTVQIVTPDARHVLRGRTYTIQRGDSEETSELTEEEIVPLLRGDFGLCLTDEEIRRAMTPKA